MLATVYRSTVTRLIFYEGRTKIKAKSEITGRKGYAAGFTGLIQHLSDVLPKNEVIEKALRKEVPVFPMLALRELVANALIHQDFAISGTGPMIEVYDDRIEITNPGRSLGDIIRLLDQAPRSRNEGLAAFMRRIGICEERGSGVDKVVYETEAFQLPPPRWEETGDAFRAILFAPKDFREMDRMEKVHACYLHACLRLVMRDPMNSSSLRERFGIEKQNSAIVSRVIKDALDEGFIRPYSEDQGKRNARYIPFWAA